MATLYNFKSRKMASHGKNDVAVPGCIVVTVRNWVKKGDDMSQIKKEKRENYIKNQALVYKRLCDKRRKLNEKSMSGELSHKQMQKLSAEQNFLGMEIEKTRERLGYALGFLLPENCQSEYNPSSFHKYSGIRKELENTKFEF